jgi:hypothetical protein
MSVADVGENWSELLDVRNAPNHAPAGLAHSRRSGRGGLERVEQPVELARRAGHGVACRALLRDSRRGVELGPPDEKSALWHAQAARWSPAIYPLLIPLFLPERASSRTPGHVVRERLPTGAEFYGYVMPCWSGWSAAGRGAFEA